MLQFFLEFEMADSFSSFSTGGRIIFDNDIAADPIYRSSAWRLAIFCVDCERMRNFFSCQGVTRKEAVWMP